MSKDTYSSYVKQLAAKLPKSVVDLSQPRKRGRSPTQAFSEFLTNRNQGDWAEDLIIRALQKCDPTIAVVKYGRGDEPVAGEEGFDEFYESYQDELDSIGKRPDLLIFEKGDITAGTTDISKFPDDELRKLVPKALAGFEVRSSAALYGKFSPGKTREWLSFTPKAEDILVILRWIYKFDVQHFFVQVLFDTAWAIPFDKILSLIATPKAKGPSWDIQQYPKNQFKSTIYVNLTEGIKLADITELPSINARRRELGRGRLLHYVEFNGGSINVNQEALRGVLQIARQWRKTKGSS